MCEFCATAYFVFCLLSFGFRLLSFGFRLLTFGFCLLSFGFRLLFYAMGGGGRLAPLLS